MMRILEIEWQVAERVEREKKEKEHRVKIEAEKEAIMRKMEENMNSTGKSVKVGAVYNDPWSKQYRWNLDAITSNIEKIRQQDPKFKSLKKFFPSMDPNDSWEVKTAWNKNVSNTEVISQILNLGKWDNQPLFQRRSNSAQSKSTSMSFRSAQKIWGVSGHRQHDIMFKKLNINEDMIHEENEIQEL